MKTFTTLALSVVFSSFPRRVTRGRGGGPIDVTYDLRRGEMSGMTATHGHDAVP